MKIIVYTDSSCAGNPGVGGYAAVLCCDGQHRVVKGFSSKVTTNNAMELKAIVEAVDWVNKHQRKPHEIEIHTNLTYITNCAKSTEKDGSKRLVGWFKGRKNEDLWLELINKTRQGKHKISFIKVSGTENEMDAAAEKIAKEECIAAKHSLLEE